MHGIAEPGARDALHTPSGIPDTTDSQKLQDNARLLHQGIRERADITLPLSHNGVAGFQWRGSLHKLAWDMWDGLTDNDESDEAFGTLLEYLVRSRNIARTRRSPETWHVASSWTGLEPTGEFTLLENELALCQVPGCMSPGGQLGNGLTERGLTLHLSRVHATTADRYAKMIKGEVPWPGQLAAEVEAELQEPAGFCAQCGHEHGYGACAEECDKCERERRLNPPEDRATDVLRAVRKPLAELLAAWDEVLEENRQLRMEGKRRGISGEPADLQDEIAALRAENAELREKNTVLRRKNADWERIFANYDDNELS